MENVNLLQHKNRGDTDPSKFRASFLRVIKSYKLVILGAESVGKSSLVTYYTQGSVPDVKEKTILASFSSINLDKSLMFNTWEVAGEERWKSLAHIYYKDAQAALIVYDVQNEDSFVCAKNWIMEMRKKLPKDLVLAIAANKIDLWDELCISSVELQSYARQNGYIYMETSAKTGQNVKNIFSAIAKELRSRLSPKQSSSHLCFCWSCQLM